MKNTCAMDKQIVTMVQMKVRKHVKVMQYRFTSEWKLREY